MALPFILLIPPPHFIFSGKSHLVCVSFQENHEFLFLLNYAHITDFLPQICQLHRASTLPAAEQNSMVIETHYPNINQCL